MVGDVEQTPQVGGPGDVSGEVQRAWDQVNRVGWDSGAMHAFALTGRAHDVALGAVMGPTRGPGAGAAAAPVVVGEYRRAASDEPSRCRDESQRGAAVNMQDVGRLAVDDLGETRE